MAIAALSIAIETRQPTPGSLIHHSDRGIQYACRDYTELLQQHDIAASMSRVGNPYDNAKAESFMKTLKQEEETAKPTVMRSRPLMPSVPSSKRCTIANGCTRRWPTGLPPSLKQIYRGAGLLRSSPAPRPDPSIGPAAPGGGRNLSLITLSHYRGALRPHRPPSSLVKYSRHAKCREWHFICMQTIAHQGRESRCFKIHSRTWSSAPRSSVCPRAWHVNRRPTWRVRVTDPAWSDYRPHRQSGVARHPGPQRRRIRCR